MSPLLLSEKTVIDIAKKRDDKITERSFSISRCARGEFWTQLDAASEKTKISTIFFVQPILT